MFLINGLGEIRKRAIGVVQLIRDYWKIYGGFAELIFSPYLFAAFIYTLLAIGYWNNSAEWTQDVLGIIPSILGFSLGGYAIFMAFSDAKFLQLLTDKDDNKSFYLALNIQFVHFVIVQIVSILLAVLAKAYLPTANQLTNATVTFGINAFIFSFVGFLAFSYAMFTALATALSLLRLGRIYHEYKKNEDDGQSS